jgi:hypothetical protein
VPYKVTIDSLALGVWLIASLNELVAALDG